MVLSEKTLARKKLTKREQAAEDRYQAATKKWLEEEEKERFNHIYCTTFCNQGHRMGDGKPVDHECYVLNPAALEAEREGDYAKAQELLWGKKGRRLVHPGLKREE
jgi:hypothetical protein